LYTKVVNVENCACPDQTYEKAYVNVSLSATVSGEYTNVYSGCDMSVKEMADVDCRASAAVCVVVVA